MPRFIAPKKFFHIETAQIGDAQGEEYRERLATLERKVEAHIQAVMQDGFFSFPNAMLDPKGNLIIVIVTGGERRILDGPQVEEVPPGTILAKPPR